MHLSVIKCLSIVAKAKIDIKNDLKDIRANIIRKELRKYHAFKGIFKGNFYYFKFFLFPFFFNKKNVYFPIMSKNFP
jgi:hypothetical protein